MGLRDDFAADHPIQAELERMGVRLIGSGDDLKACCPFHEDRNPSFSVNIKDGSWKCFAGCGQGGVVELIARHQGKTPQFILDTYKAEKNGGHSKNPPSPPVKLVDWKSCVDQFDSLEQFELCEQRGYSPKFAEQLVERKMIGVCDGNWCFPIYAGGHVIGTHQKLKNGGWVIRGGSSNPWVIGDHFENVAIFESQWDAFAFMDKVGWFTAGFDANSAIVITRGAQRGKAIQNLFKPDGHLVVFMQNDPLSEDGSSPAEKWLLDILSVVRKAHVVRPPKDHKDINDWARAGATTSDFISAWESAELKRDPRLPELRPPLSFSLAMKFNPKADPDCLIGNRYLCRGGSALWVGGSGIGKSVITLQAAIMFALGEDLFGLTPKRPLRSVILSAEDDFGDIAEVVQGVAAGLGIQADSKKFKAIEESVVIYQESTLKGLPFIGYCQELVVEHKADLLWINPLLSYYGSNPSDPEKAAEFTGALSQMQFETKVCTQLVHHTGKPKDSKTTEAFSIEDFSYIGLGSSVWTNWARAILVLQSLKQPKNTFVLRLAKRGQRSGVVNDDYEKVREIYLQHGSKGLVWETSDFCPGDDENSTTGRPTKVSWSKINEAWDGRDKSTPELKALIREFCPCSDKSAWRFVSSWSGVYITKNEKDLWVKLKQ